MGKDDCSRRSSDPAIPCLTSLRDRMSGISMLLVDWQDGGLVVLAHGGDREVE